MRPDHTGLPLAAWRLAKTGYADLSGDGARHHGGRWNSPGRSVVYLSEETALPVLEMLVHLDLSRELIPSDYVLMRVGLADLAESAVEQGPGLIEERECRVFGDRWLEEKRSLLLRVPSAIIEESHNLLLNPAHPLSGHLPAPIRRSFGFDIRLLRE